MNGDSIIGAIWFILLALFTMVALYRCGFANELPIIGKKDKLVSVVLILLSSVIAAYVIAREDGMFYFTDGLASKSMNTLLIELFEGNVPIVKLFQCIFLMTPTFLVLGVFLKKVSDRVLRMSSNLFVPILIEVGVLFIYTYKWGIEHSLIALFAIILVYCVHNIYKRLRKTRYIYPMLCIVAMPVCTVEIEVYMQVLLVVVFSATVTFCANLAFKYSRYLREYYKVIINVIVVAGSLCLENAIINCIIG